MKVTAERVLSDEDVDAFYPTYVLSWQPLLTLAAARHVLTEEEFGKEMADPRIEKLVVRDDQGTAVALSTLTNDLSAVEWINPSYYRSRYPDEVGREAVFYLGYLLVDPARRRSNALMLLAAEISRRAADVRGLVAFDLCGYNDEHGLGRFSRWLLAPGRIEQLDTQAYYVADYRDAVQAPEERPAARPAEPAEASLTTTTLAERPDLISEIAGLLSTRWPTFMLAGHPGHDVDLEELLTAVPQHQVLVLDEHDRLQAAGLSVPISWDGTVADLPQGWDDAVTRSARLLASDEPRNAACALSITVAPAASGRGLAARVVRALREAAREAGAHALLAPVRPVLKPRYPLVEMAEYTRWRTDDGQHFDPWLRLHVRLGGQVLGVCEASMTITDSVEEWSTWIDDALPGQGAFVVPGALAPLVVERGNGTYVEPNVWVLHPAAA